MQGRKCTLACTCATPLPARPSHDVRPCAGAEQGAAALLLLLRLLRAVRNSQQPLVRLVRQPARAGSDLRWNTSRFYRCWTENPPLFDRNGHF